MKYRFHGDVGAQERMVDLRSDVRARAMIDIDGEWVCCRVYRSEQANGLRMGRLRASTKASVAEIAVSLLMLPYSQVVDTRKENGAFWICSPIEYEMTTKTPTLGIQRELPCRGTKPVGSHCTHSSRKLA